jgi:radical SAM-linked protein
MRIRVTFSKTEAMRFTGHLDLHRTWERVLRRAKLPLTYSQGFKPHARINLACALPLGFTSQGDLVDIQLDGDLPLQEVTLKLQKAVPPGIRIEAVVEIDASAPTLQSLLVAQYYTITFLEPQPQLQERISELLQAESLPRQRNHKTYDLRPLILSMQSLPNDELTNPRLQVTLSAREGATGRPEEVILALGSAPEACRVHREGLIFSLPDKVAVPEN